MIIAVMIYFAFDIQRSGSELIPLVVGLCTLALMILLLLMTLFPKFALWYKHLEGSVAPSLSSIAYKTDEKYDETEHKQIRKKEIAVAAWLVFLTSVTYILGFFIAIPIFLFLFLKLWASEGWGVSLGMPVVVLGAIYFIFVYILQIPLHEGIFFNF